MRDNCVDLETAITDATITDQADVDRLVELHRHYAATREALARVELRSVD